MRLLFCLGLLLCSSTLRAQQEVVVQSLDGTLLSAWWFKPTSDSIPEVPRPVVVALHGCGGLYASTGERKGLLNARHQAMGTMLQGMGYHVVFPDSLTARGETSLCVQAIGTRNIGQTQRRSDAFGALAWVRAQPWADPARVAVIGWSHGGSAVLAVTQAVLGPLNVPLTKSAGDVDRRGAASTEPFKTAIAFYPGCSDSLAKKYQPNTSLTLFLGADDDWTPPGPCIALMQRLKAASPPSPHSLELHVYPNAVHDFDTPLPGVRERKEIPSRLHPGKGVMAGQNLAAREASYKRLQEILQAALR